MHRKTVSTSPSFSLLYKPWERLSARDRDMEICRYAEANGGKAVTINLRPKIEEKMKKNKDPSRYISKRMNEALNKLDLRQLPVLIAIESTRSEPRLHLHGVYQEHGYAQSRIHQAMRNAAGYIKGRSGSRQIMADAVYPGEGWCTYITKAHRWTSRHLSTKNRLIWVSTPMTQIVSAEYEARRLGQTQPANTNGTTSIAS